MLRYFNIILIILISCSVFAEDNIISKAKKYISNDYKELLFVSIENQKLYYIKNDSIINTYIISSSKYGIGNKNNSNKTPLGLHKIKGKYGDNIPNNGIIVGRIFTGKIATIYKTSSDNKKDEITSRILWLEGLEKNINKGLGIDSYSRYIYIHGTSEEGNLGFPSSHGCIRMGNKDVIDLYKMVKVNTLVLIL